jgi:hypothetical protein
MSWGIEHQIAYLPDTEDNNKDTEARVVKPNIGKVEIEEERVQRPPVPTMRRGREKNVEG